MVRVLHNSPAPLGLEGSWADCYPGQILLLSQRARALTTLLCMDVLTALWTASPFSTPGVLGVLEVSPCPPIPVPHTWSSLLPELSQQAPRKHGPLPPGCLLQVPECPVFPLVTGPTRADLP